MDWDKYLNKAEFEQALSGLGGQVDFIEDEWQKFRKIFTVTCLNNAFLQLSEPERTEIMSGVDLQAQGGSQLFVDRLEKYLSEHGDKINDLEGLAKRSALQAKEIYLRTISKT